MKIFDILFKKNILKKIQNKNKIVRLIIYLISCFMVSLTYNTFFVKNNIVIGGMSGLAIIIKDVCGLDTSVFIILSTFVLLILSYITLGKESTKKNLFGALVYPIFVTITAPISNLINIKFNSFLFTVFFSVLIYGIFLGLIYKIGYSTGGGDILNEIICKYRKKSIGQASNSMNIIIILTSIFTFGIPIAIYDIFALLLSNKIIDFIILGNSDSKLCIIKTKNIKYIEQFINNNFNVGYSILDTKGGIDTKKRRTIFCVVTSREYYKFKNLILDIDPHAFFVTHDCYEVLGGKQNKLIN